jgi:hypothetical protein
MLGRSEAIDQYAWSYKGLGRPNRWTAAVTKLDTKKFPVVDEDMRSGPFEAQDSSRDSSGFRDKKSGSQSGSAFLVYATSSYRECFRSITTNPTSPVPKSKSVDGSGTP